MNNRYTRLTPKGRGLVLVAIVIPAAIAACTLIMVPSQFGFGG